MKRFVVVIGLLFSHYAHALDEWHIAIINDADGFTFIRAGAGKNFPVIDTVQKNAFFYCIGDTTCQWISVQDPLGKSGFMHRSRIIFFHELVSAQQHKLILDAFQETIEIRNSYWTKVKNFPKEKIVLLNMERDRVHEEKYIPAYTAFKKLFCERPDSILLVAFFKTLQPLSGSADEGKDWTTAECWLCNPKIVENIVCHWKDESERQTIISSIETGMAMAEYDAQFSPEKLKQMYMKLEIKCN